jgi:hypothetical protein
MSAGPTADACGTRWRDMMSPSWEFEGGEFVAILALFGPEAIV